MRNLRTAIWVLLLAMAGGLVHAQSARSATSGTRLVFSSSPQIDPSTVPSGEILREIDDPHNGDRWLLLRDESHPAGPGHLVLVSPVRSAAETPKQTGREANAPPPLIRAGDHILIEEHAAIVDARLEAVATEPAWLGSVFNARLAIGGKIVRAVAAGHGRAILKEVTGQ